MLHASASTATILIVAVSCVLFTSAMLKALAPGSGIGLLLRLGFQPKPARAASAALVPAEGATALVLLGGSGTGRLVAITAALTLFVCGAVFSGIALRRGITESCGCFGAFSGTASAGSAATIVRNLLLVGGLEAGALLVSWDRAIFTWGGAIAVVTSTAVLAGAAHWAGARRHRAASATRATDDRIAGVVAEGGVVVAVTPGCSMCHDLLARIGPVPEAEVLFVSLGDPEQTARDFGRALHSADRTALAEGYGLVGAPAAIWLSDSGSPAIVYGLDIERAIAARLARRRHPEL